MATIIHEIQNWWLHVNNIVICFFHGCSKGTISRCRSEVWIRRERRDPIPGWFVELAEEIIAFIWNGHSAFIWVNGAEGEIFCCGLTLCQHIEKGWLPENKYSTEVNPSRSEDSIIHPQTLQYLMQDWLLIFWKEGKFFFGRFHIWALELVILCKIPCPLTRSNNPVIDQLYMEWRGKLHFW